MTTLLSSFEGRGFMMVAMQETETVEASMLCSSIDLQCKRCLEMCHGVLPYLAMAHRNLHIWNLVICSSSKS